MIADVAVKFALKLLVQPLVNGPAAVVPQFEAVQVDEVPLVFQNRSVAEGIGAAGGLNVCVVLLAKIVEDQRSEIRGRRSVLVACAGGFIHACSLSHDRE